MGDVEVLVPTLPTLDSLGVGALPPDLDVEKVGTAWFEAFAQHVSAGDTAGLLSTFVEDGWWRDMLAFTWEFRTFHGRAKIGRFLEDRLAPSKVEALKLGTVELDKVADDLIWIQGFFTFQTDVALASGVFRLIPSPSGTWKAHHVYTNLEDLKAFPEKIGSNRNFLPNHGKWLDQRKREREFLDKDPTVVVVGGGQSGLDVAARLKLLDVPTLVVERNKRIGDQWRGRYQALCLHDPVWYDHMPYIPFPANWPVYTPAQKLADWLEFYAESMELDVWTDSEVEHFKQRDDLTWDVRVRRADGSIRDLNVQHVVMALGLGAGTPSVPNVLNREEFQGQVLHSSSHNVAADHAGKKVVIIGAATSAHDIAGDYADNGVDVTMVQREPTYIMTTKNGMPKMLSRLYWEGSKYPTEVADRLNAATPTWVQKFLWQRIAKDIYQTDKKLVHDLEAVGFKTYQGIDDAGFLYTAMNRGGGYYLDVGTSQRIIDGKIKLKNGRVARFTKTGVEFEDGSTLDADVVMFATGFASPITAIAKLAGEEVASKITPIWGLNEEGELRTAWRWLGVPRLWFMMGNLAWCRFHSKHLALQIKAQLEGVYGERYLA